MPSFHIYIHYKQNGKETLDYPNDVNFNRQEVEEIVKKYENGKDFLLGGLEISSDTSHIKKFEIWETPHVLDPPVDWNEMWRIARLVTKEFTASTPGSRKQVAKEKKEDVRVKEGSTAWDLFICHASEDKEDIVRPLVEALIRKGFHVWYDEFTLTIGDSLRRSIDKGLGQSRYGLVILSPSFFAKNWTQTELDGLAAKERDGKKVILPVWHEIDEEYIKRFSPTLADKVAVSTKKGIGLIVKEILKVVQPRKTGFVQKAITESTRKRLERALVALKGKDKEFLTETVTKTDFSNLKRTFFDVLDGIAILDLPQTITDESVFDFIELAILERNEKEGAELFETLLNWYFQTVTPYCKLQIAKIFAKLTRLLFMKEIISKTRRVGSFVAEFGLSNSYSIAAFNSEIIMNIQSLLSNEDLARVVDSALANDQILPSWGAKEYLKKILVSCEGRVDKAKIEELSKKLGP